MHDSTSVHAESREQRHRRSLRVCHVAYTFYENDNRVIRYAEALADRGHQVDVIALRRPGQSKIEQLRGVTIHRIQRRVVTERSVWVYLFKLLSFFARSTLRLTARQLRRRYDLIHVHNVPDFLVFAAIAPKLMGARVILDVHDILPELFAGKFGAKRESVVFRLLLMVERWSCAFASHVIVANHLWCDKLVSRSVTSGKCTTIMNYPDLTLFRPSSDSPQNGKFVFLYPGTLNHHQGVDIAVRAFADVAKRIHHAEFHVYGEGPARPEIEQLVSTLGLVDRVKIMDRVPLKDVCALMASADVGVVPKRADGFGNEAFSTKVLEFMACGVPVILARTLVDSYYFDDTLVRFFTPGDERDLAEAMLAVYERRADQSQWIHTAQMFAIRNGWQTRVTEYLQLVAKLDANSRVGRVATDAPAGAPEAHQVDTVSPHQTTVPYDVCDPR
jgi:glycosyltransferase involved in cell wall biosynthesis